MTETEWLHCTHPDSMLVFLGQRASDRQRRLFVLAWCRWYCPWLNGWSLGDAATEADCRRAVDVAERFIEGRATIQERGQAYKACADWAAGWSSWDLGLYYEAALAAATVAAEPGPIPDPPYLQAEWTQRKLAAEHAAQAALLREIVGNPFRRPVIDPTWLSFQGGIVVQLARQIDAGAFHLLPILGDALEDAGCTDADLLRHCRGTDGFPARATPGPLRKSAALPPARLVARRPSAGPVRVARARLLGRRRRIRSRGEADSTESVLRTLKVKK